MKSEMFDDDERCAQCGEAVSDFGPSCSCAFTPRSPRASSSSAHPTAPPPVASTMRSMARRRWAKKTVET